VPLFADGNDAVSERTIPAPDGQVIPRRARLFREFPTGVPDGNRDGFAARSGMRNSSGTLLME
jgi:hypothetical protein